MTNFTLKCPLKEYAKLLFWVEHCSIEGGGPFYIKEDKAKKCYRLTVADIVKQVASPASINYEDKAYSEYTQMKSKAEKIAYEDVIMGHMTETGAKELTQVSFPKMKKFVNTYKQKAGYLYGQWHSHVRMGCGPSGTDVNNAHLMCESMPQMFMLIMNKMHEYTLTRFEQGIISSQIVGTLEIVDEDDNKIVIEDKNNLLKTMTESIKNSLDKKYPELAKRLIASTEDYCTNTEECISVEELKIMYPGLEEICKKEIDELVFDSSQYQINEDTGEIEKKPFGYHQSNYRFNQEHYAGHEFDEPHIPDYVYPKGYAPTGYKGKKHHYKNFIKDEKHHVGTKSPDEAQKILDLIVEKNRKSALEVLTQRPDHNGSCIDL